jgi:hypothetical protein
LEFEKEKRILPCLVSNGEKLKGEIAELEAELEAEIDSEKIDLNGVAVLKKALHDKKTEYGRLNERISVLNEQRDETNYILEVAEVLFDREESKRLSNYERIEYDVKPAGEFVALFVNKELHPLFGSEGMTLLLSLTGKELKTVYVYHLRKGTGTDNPMANLSIIENGTVSFVRFNIGVGNTMTVGDAIYANGIPLDSGKIELLVDEQPQESSYSERYSKIVNVYDHRKRKTMDDEVCSNCGMSNVSYIDKTATYTCIDCGFSTYEGVVSGIEGVPFNHLVAMRKSRTDYQPIMHLNDILAAIQAQETMIVDEDILQEVDKERRKHRIEPNELTQDNVRRYLQKLSKSKRDDKKEKKRYADCYEHIPQIILKLGGPAPELYDMGQLERIRRWFLKITNAFKIFCPRTGKGSRKNLINYNYIIYQIHMLEWEVCADEEEKDFWIRQSKKFRMLKDKKKLMEYDGLFSKIANFLNINFFVAPQ